MRFRCERDVLADALSTAQRAVSNRSSLAVLSGIHLQLRGDRLVLTGSDLDLTITVVVAVASDEDGDTVIPAKLATDVVRSLDSGAIDVVCADGHASISQGRSQFSLLLIPAEEYPQVGEVAGDSVELDAAHFAEGLKQVVKAASGDDSRPILTGVLMASENGGLRLVATDSYRLAVRDLPGTSVLAEGQQVLVPSRSLREVERLLGTGGQVALTLGERDASFQVGDVRLTTRLIEGEFPNYRNLIPAAQPNRLTVQREALIEAVSRVKLMARETTPVRLTFHPDLVELMAITQDVGQAQEAVDGKYEGAEMTVAFNPEYLLQGLEVTPGDEISLETVDALKPALLRSTESPDYLYLLMPVRVS